MNKGQLFRSVLIILVIVLTGFFLRQTAKKSQFKVMAQTASVAANDIIDQVLVPPSTGLATDVSSEIQDLVTGYVNDSNDYNGLALQANHTYTLLLYFRGRNTSTLAPILPLLPGTVSDTTSLKGKLATRLKNEVKNYLLQQGLWDFEHMYDQPSNGNSTWYTARPNTSVSWYHRYLTGPHWEKFYAIWAYAYYTGDWDTVSSNLSFLKSRYNEGDQNRSNQVYFFANDFVYRDDPVHLALGLIGFTRILDHFNDSMEATVRSKAITALGYLNDPSFTDRAVSSGLVKYGWDLASGAVRYEYPPCQDMTPEIGRWFQAVQSSIISTRIDQAINSTELKDRYQANMFNNYNRNWPSYDEAQWGLPGVSNELYNCRAWVGNVTYTQLKNEKPWPVVMGRIPKYRDMLYLQSLYTLLIKSGTPTWQVAEPN